MANDPRHGGKGFRVVNGGGFAIEAIACWKGRLKPRLTLLTLKRLEKRCLFAADVGSVAMMRMQLEMKTLTQNILAKKTCSTGLVKGLLKPLVGREDFAMNVVVAHRNTHGIGRNGHTLDEHMGVVAKDVTVFEGAWLALVGITDQILLNRKLCGHEAPLQSSWKARTPASAQRRGLDLGNDLFLGHARAAIGTQNFTQSLVTVARLVVA